MSNFVKYFFESENMGNFSETNRVLGAVKENQNISVKQRWKGG
jgi:hypothetical protein